MNHLLLSPPPELAHLVRCFWVFEMNSADNASVQVSTFVNDSTGLTFVLDRNNPLYRATVEGYNTEAKVFEPVKGIQALGVQFLPGALSRFFGFGAHEFTGRDTNLRDVISWDIAETLINTKDTAARLDVLTNFLITMLKKNDHQEPWITKLVQQIYISKGKLSVTQFQKDFGRSQRQIERRLLDTVGVSARHLAKVLRFQESISMMRSNPQLSLLDIAYLCGFYDHAHFIRDVRKLSGFTPTNLRERLNKIPVNQKGSTRYLIDIIPDRQITQINLTP